MADNQFKIGLGIPLTTGFDVAGKVPLDARSVVNTMDELMAMPSYVVYEGLMVFVIEENKIYQWKMNIPEDETQSPYIGWGAIESEVSAKELKEAKDLLEIDWNNTQSLLMQKNKKDFFPIAHEDFIYVDADGKTMFDKYQTRADNTLQTESITIPEAINELNTKMDDAIVEFRENAEALESELRANMEAFRQQAEEDFDAMREAMQNKISETEEEIADKMEEVDRKIANLEASVEDRVDQMLQDVDNSILSDNDVNNFMQQILANINTLNGM